MWERKWDREGWGGVGGGGGGSFYSFQLFAERAGCRHGAETLTDAAVFVLLPLRATHGSSGHTSCSMQQFRCHSQIIMSKKKKKKPSPLFSLPPPHPPTPSAPSSPHTQLLASLSPSRFSSLVLSSPDNRHGASPNKRFPYFGAESEGEALGAEQLLAATSPTT